jgi:hypothetical protein
MFQGSSTIGQFLVVHWYVNAISKRVSNFTWVKSILGRGKALMHMDVVAAFHSILNPLTEANSHEIFIKVDNRCMQYTRKSSLEHFY